MKLLTAKKGEPHLTSMHFRAMLEAICGTGSYTANLYELLEPELATNNVIKIRSGLLTHHGGLFLIEPGTYDEVSYINGTQGMKRIDLVVARYTKDADTGIENGEWIVIQGTPTESDPVAPEHTVGNMQNGDLIDDCPVFEVHLDGINVVDVKKLVDVAPNLHELKEFGTNSSPQFAYLWLSSHVTVEGGNTIPFDNYITKGTAFSVSSGIITVEEDLEYVRINATVGGSSASNRIWMRILRNNETVYDALAEGMYISASGGTICSTKKGDFFSVYVNEECTVKDGGVGCYFNIEKIC